MRPVRSGIILVAIYCAEMLVAQTSAASAGKAFERGGAEYLKGNFLADEKWFRQAAQLSPAMVDAHEFLGHSLFKQERYREAIPVYQDALKLDSKRVLPSDRRIALFVLVNARTIATNIQNAFRGGPRPPSHPIPANDSSFLNRRRFRVQRGKHRRLASS